MKSSTDLRNLFFGLLAAFLILVQSIGVVYSSTDAAGQRPDHHPAVLQKALTQANVAEVVPLLVLPTFLFYWVINHLATLVNRTVIRYQTCQLFSVHPSSFNSYYVHLSALAP